MIFSLGELFAIGFIYLSMLFGIAYIADKGWIPDRVVRHPVVFILSLGVIASAWAFYGMVGVAWQYGYGFLAYFFGVSGLFLFAPLIIVPLLRISRIYQLKSLADLLAFRYRSHWVGVIVTIFMVVAMLPLLALQIAAVSDTVHILTQQGSEVLSPANRQTGLAFAFCCIITLFTVLFGTRHLAARERHNGLICAIAFESLSKLMVLMVLGSVVFFRVFGGPDGVGNWLTNNADKLTALSSSLQSQEARGLLLIFFTAAVGMPHLFHMLFAERPNRRALRAASWGFPLFLLLLSMPILPILWGGIKLHSPLPVQYFSLGIGLSLESPYLAILAFVGGLSAASGTIIVCTIALASMSLNHILLAVYQPDTDRDIYRWLQWTRRLLITAIILMSYLFFRIVGDQALADLGIAAFSAVLQFTPGILAILYWPNANRNGFIAGLCGGMSVWIFLVLLPLLMPGHLRDIELLIGSAAPDTTIWQIATITSLGLNVFLFVLVSMASKTSEEERAAAEICSTDDLRRPIRQGLDVNSPTEMKSRLVQSLGKTTAQREVDNALLELGLSDTESRPYALRRLRDQVEANLSGLFGPSIAHDIVNRLLPYTQPAAGLRTEDIYYIESNLEVNQEMLTGLAAELDGLRRYHRETLQNLPIGVCTLGADKEIIMWNRTMEELTGIESNAVLGSSLATLDEPWQNVIAEFSEVSVAHRYKQHIIVNGTGRWISLHKTQSVGTDQTILIEDLTETQLLEHELAHSERLASVGRLAAGVAHEIGNPITGIACLAQNLRYEESTHDIQETSSEILRQTDRITKIVQSLVNFAHAGNHSGKQAFRPVGIATCASDAIDLLRLNKHAREVQFEQHCAANLYVLGDAQRLLQVFVNLLSNARDASATGGRVIVEANERMETIEIEVRDQGSGITPDVLEQIYDPFFTTKEPGEGTGLGLTLVYSIVEDHDGQMLIQSPIEIDGEAWTRVCIRIPKCSALQLADFEAGIATH
ncbi:MAG: sensor histidine kinase [Pseudomonadales bacterium]